MDGVDHVAALGLLGQAGGGSEGQHLVALGRGGPVGQHHQTGGGEALVQLEHLRGAGQGAEVEHRHLRVVALDRALERRWGDPVGQQLEVGILGHQLGQAERDEILELRQDHAHVPTHGRAVYGGATGETNPARSPPYLPPGSLGRGEEAGLPGGTEWFPNLKGRTGVRQLHNEKPAHRGRFSRFWGR